MQRDLEIYSTTDCFENSQINLVAKFYNFPLVWTYSNKQFAQSQLFKNFPYGRYPALKTSEGIIFSSNTILRYFARKGKSMYGKNLIQHTQIDQWLQFCATQLNPLFIVLSGVINKKALLPRRVYNIYMNELNKIMQNLNNHMKTKQWLAGINISIADLAVVSYLQYWFMNVFEEEYRSKIPYITSWFINISHTPQFLEVYGSNTFCSLFVKPVQFIHQEGEQSQVEIKAQQSKKQQIVFESWLHKIKHQMLNSPNKKQVIADMLSNFNEQHSLYLIIYQSYYNQCSDQIKTINLRSSILAYLMSLRNQSFAVTGVYQQDKSYSIKGVWLFEDKQIPKEWSKHPLFIYHTFEKLSPTQVKHRQIVEEYWLNIQNNKTVEAMTVVTAKYFA